MVRKSSAAATEDQQDTAAEQIEGQVDIIDSFPGHGYIDRSDSDAFEQAEALPEAEKDEPADEFAGLDERTKKQRLYSRAQSIIFAKHRDEFNQVADALFKEHGLVFSRKKTPKEKAADEIRAKLEEFPELRVEFPGLALEAKAEGTEGVSIA